MKAPKSLPPDSIMSGDYSRPMWAAINSIKGRGAREAVYFLGSRCQELESLLRAALERIAKLEAYTTDLVEYDVLKRVAKLEECTADLSECLEELDTRAKPLSDNEEART